MNSYYRFGIFEDKMLITNEMGNYALLSNEEFEMFSQNKINRETKLYNDLVNKGFIIDSSLESYIQKVQYDISKSHAYLYSATSLFIIVVTNMCNNSCVYCQANGCSKHEELMSEKTAELIIEKIKECPSRKITIEFQGGEPLLNFKAIRAAVNKAKAILTDKEVEFCLVSNLAALTDEMISFFIHNNVSVSTSIDGPAFLHDKNRPGKNGERTFQTVKSKMNVLRQNNVHVGGIQTTTRYSLPFSKEIIQTYVECGFDSVFVRPLTELGEAKRKWNEIGYSPEEFIDFYRSCLTEVIKINLSGRKFIENHAEILLRKMLGYPAPNYMELRSPCGAGVGQMAFVPNGNVYTCDEGRMAAEMGVDVFCLGNIYNNSYNDWIESSTCKTVCAASLLEGIPECCDCVYQIYCGTCPVITYMTEGNLFSSTPNHYRCKVYKGIIKTVLKFLIEDEEPAYVLRSWLEM